MSQLYRLRIDVRRIQANLHDYEGVFMPESQIRSWLNNAGFVPDRTNDAERWFADQSTCNCLDETEILEVVPVEAITALH